MTKKNEDTIGKGKVTKKWQSPPRIDADSSGRQNDTCSSRPKSRIYLWDYEYHNRRTTPGPQYSTYYADY